MSEVNDPNDPNEYTPIPLDSELVVADNKANNVSLSPITTEQVANKGITQLEYFDKLANTNTAQVLTAATNQKALDLIANNEQVKERVEQAASDIIDTHLVAEKATATAKQNDATFVVNQEACKVYGVDKPVHKWQQKLLVVGSGFWFIVYFIVASVTVAPVSTFALKLNVVFKNIWIAIVVAILVYVAVVVLIPLVIKWSGG